MTKNILQTGNIVMNVFEKVFHYKAKKTPQNKKSKN